MQPFVPNRDSEPEEIEPDFLLKAYNLGVFPMAMHDGEIAWFSPDPRGVIPLDRFHIPKGLRRALKKKPYEVRYNTAFREVMRLCGENFGERDSTWIDDTIIQAYGELHDRGFAHSVEAWKDDELVGGLYGVSIGGAFFGESMFTRATDASKIALVHLVNRMNERGMILLDTQWTTDHLTQFGCEEIPRSEYLRTLARAVEMDVRFYP